MRVSPLRERTPTGTWSIFYGIHIKQVLTVQLQKLYVRVCRVSPLYSTAWYKYVRSTVLLSPLARQVVLLFVMLAAS